MISLDCTGMLCPLPVIELARAFGEVGIGGLIEVLSDDPAAETDIAAWCRLRGQELVSTDARTGVSTYVVRRVQ